MGLSKNSPSSPLFSEEEFPLLQLCHVFAQASVWLEKGMADHEATYDLFVRHMPVHRNFLVAAGLEEILAQLQKLKFSPEDIAFLKEGGLVSDRCAEYLRTFRFTGSIHALPEGTIFFPYEPIVRVMAPLIEASLIETYMISVLSSNVPFATKAARLKLAVKNDIKLTVGPFRAHSFESGAKASRSALFYGIGSLGNYSIAKKYHLPVPKPPVIAQHLFIKSFPTELDAFRAITNAFPNRGSFMVDTYNFRPGMQNAITVFSEQKQKGHTMGAVVIDSGDLIEQARYARKELDTVGLTDIKIVLGGNLDEYKLNDFIQQNVPCDLAFVVTEYVTLSDSPTLEVVYKLAESRFDGQIQYGAKLAPGKLSYPGRKQVYRQLKNGVLEKDILALEGEQNQSGEPLLKEYMKEGRLIVEMPDLTAIEEYATHQLNQLPESLKSLTTESKFDVMPSDALISVLEDLRRKHGNS